MHFEADMTEITKYQSEQWLPPSCMHYLYLPSRGRLADPVSCTCLLPHLINLRSTYWLLKHTSNAAPPLPDTHPARCCRTTWIHSTCLVQTSQLPTNADREGQWRATGIHVLKHFFCSQPFSFPEARGSEGQVSCVVSQCYLISCSQSVCWRRGSELDQQHWMTEHGVRWGLQFCL